MKSNLERPQDDDEYDISELNPDMDADEDPIKEEISALYEKYQIEDYLSVLSSVEKLIKDYPLHPDLVILYMSALDSTEQYESVTSLYNEKKAVKGKRSCVLGKQPLPVILNVKALCRSGNEELAKEILQDVIKGDIDHFHNLQYIGNLHLLKDESVSEMAFELGLQCAQEWIESNRSEATGVTDEGDEYYDESEDDIIEEWFHVVEWLRNGGTKLRAYLEQTLEAESGMYIEWFIEELFHWESHHFGITTYSEEEMNEILEGWFRSLESDKLHGD